MVDRLEDGRYYENGIHLTDFGLPFCVRLPVRGQPSSVPGTRAYLAPEVLESGEAAISPKSDIWAMGCIGYELCIGTKLAGNRQLLKQHIAEGQKTSEFLNLLIANIPSTRFGDGVRIVIRSCLQWDSKNRHTAAELRDYLLQLPRR